ncbi:hypothetical protein [Clostridium sp. YIM B02551]|uniref:hypothetical protein n=1 Tax=Clostridium sp. YIM B02551 TaxID=2910679 RepID=UPI001EEACC81|nr:hypothetical protein [Clostridium sp. YIM B02551]
MINCLCKKETMTISEFLNMQDETNERRLEILASKIRKNKQLERFTVTLMACCLYAQKVLAAEDGVDRLGNKLLFLLRKWAKWILLIMCVLECIKAGVNGDSKNILKIIMKYVLLYASLFLVPYLFDVIAESFS